MACFRTFLLSQNVVMFLKGSLCSERKNDWNAGRAGLDLLSGRLLYKYKEPRTYVRGSFACQDSPVQKRVSMAASCWRVIEALGRTEPSSYPVRIPTSVAQLMAVSYQAPASMSV